jgi:putative colanic acid biosynthesis acetyltransferase WcaF
VETDFERYRYIDSLPLHDKLRRLLWDTIWLLVFRPTPRWAFHAWRRMVLRAFGAKIGEGSRISPTCRIWAPWNLEIGDYTVLADNVDCYCVGTIKIGSKVAVSQRSFLCTASHRTDSLLRPLTIAPIVIGDHVWVAAESFLHPGVTIGEGAVVGARSVVTRDIPPWQICVGNPCKPIKARILDKPDIHDKR